LEKIPRELAKKVSESISIPTIGIGAGPDCDGQVLVLHDLLGITMDFSPRFLRRYLNLSTDINNAITQYCDDVRSGDFPSEDESYSE
jgi:3-methyl-2-oxobutanoate hydroxymethyltransferase